MTDFIDVPIETDPEALATDAFDRFQARFPGWVPNAGNLEVILIEAAARMAAEVRDVASTVPTSVFRSFGASVLAVAPVNASQATGASTWTMRDTAGYTIPAGTQVGIPAAGDELVAFTVLADVTVAPGDSATAAGEVTLVAVEAGSSGSGLTGDPQLLSNLDFVTGITLDSETTGGVDAESDQDYLNRLAARLQLLTPRPILPSDFAVLARDVAGVARALALDGYNPNANELETITVNATGGTFTLTFDGQTTAAIAWNASAATVQTALEALSNVAPGDVLVTGGPLGTAAVQVEFAGAYDGTDVTQMTADSSSLTGGAATATIATTRQGSARTGNERMVAVALVDEAGEPVTTLAKTTVDANLQAQREVNFVVNVIDATYTAIDVAFTAVTLAGWDATDVHDRAVAAVEAYLSPATWGSTADEPDTWVASPTVRYLDVATVLNNVTGLDYLTALQIAVHLGTLATADVTLAGAAALPQPGTITGTVTNP